MSLGDVWFVLGVLPLVVFVVLDGIDIGAGMLMPWVARDDEQREQVFAAVGPVWDANEVWLLMGAATMMLAFPAAVGAALSGFYLPLMLVLWLLTFRALGIEMRHFIGHALWSAFWEKAFFLASAALACVLGLALGNILRGVDWHDGPEPGFFVAFWTDFGVRAPVGIIDVYTTSVAVYACMALACHAACWLALRCDDRVGERALHLCARIASFMLFVLLCVTWATHQVQPRIAATLERAPIAVLAPCFALAGLLALMLAARRRQAGRAMMASTLHLAAALVTAALGIYPYLIPGTVAGTGLTVRDAASGDYALMVALWWWIPGMIAISAIFVWQYRRQLQSPRLGAGTSSH